MQTLNALPENIQGSFLKGLLLLEGAKVETYPVIENLTNFMKAFFVTTVFDQMGTVSLPKYPGLTPDNRKTRADNHLKVYESLGMLSDEHLSLLSEIIQKTDEDEVKIPSPVADFLRESGADLFLNPPRTREALVNTSILIRKARELDLIDDSNLPKLIPEFPVGLYDAKQVAEKVGLLLKLNDHIDQMKGLGILDGQQVKTLKKNMGAQASKTTYLHRQENSLHKLVYLAAEAKQHGESFGPKEVAQYIMTQDMLNPKGEDQQICTLDRIKVHQSLRTDPEMGAGTISQIGRLGRKILERMLKKEDYSDLVSQGMKLRKFESPLKTRPEKAQ